MLGEGLGAPDDQGDAEEERQDPENDDSGAPPQDARQSRNAPAFIASTGRGRLFPLQL
jgi:hypothetical protein